MTEIVVPPGQWVPITELQIEVRHDESHAKVLHYNIVEGQYIFRGNFSWLVRRLEANYDAH